MKKIMIVEDDKSISSELKDLLNNAGYNGVVLKDFENSYEEIKKENPDLILLDINIPKLNGEMLLQKIRKKSNVPIIMVTSKNTEADEVLSMSYGADEKMINKSLFRQIAIFFIFPLLVAIIHSIFGITFCSYIIETFGNEQLLNSIIMTAIFIVVIYGGYFLITYLCSKNIVKEK